MSKKVQPDTKTRTIQYINKDNESAKENAYLKSKHVVDTKSTNKTFGTISFTMNDTNNNEYKMTNHVSEEDE